MGRSIQEQHPFMSSNHFDAMASEDSEQLLVDPAGAVYVRPAHPATLVNRDHCHGIL